MNGGFLQCVDRIFFPLVIQTPIDVPRMASPFVGELHPGIKIKLDQMQFVRLKIVDDKAIFPYKIDHPKSIDCGISRFFIERTIPLLVKNILHHHKPIASQGITRNFGKFGSGEQIAVGEGILGNIRKIFHVVKSPVQRQRNDGIGRDAAFANCLQGDDGCSEKHVFHVGGRNVVRDAVVVMPRTVGRLLFYRLFYSDVFGGSQCAHILNGFLDILRNICNQSDVRQKLGGPAGFSYGGIYCLYGGTSDFKTQIDVLSNSFQFAGLGCVIHVIFQF